MPADQAAGLRRRSARQPPRSIHCFFDTAESTDRLAHSLHQRGWTSLLVDTHGRVFADSPTRSLFDWRQQVTRGQLQTLPMPWGDGWHAPGMQGDVPALLSAVEGYDCFLFDASPDGPDWLPRPGTVPMFVVEVKATHASMQRGYAVLKTLSHSGGACSAWLLGDQAACDRLMAACAQFLEPSFARGVRSVAHEDDVFSVLAVRMTSGRQA